MLYETIDRDYDVKVDLSIKKEMEEIINVIQPETPENMENRIRFEKCLASTIMYRDKRIIYTFIGMTKSGKTTIKCMLAKALTQFMSDSCNINAFAEAVSSGPKHELANTANKTLICVSEVPQNFKISSQIFKTLTEPTLVARRNYSTETTNQINNVATYIFDCNSVIDFTEHTPSVYQRLCTISFNNVKFSSGDEEMESIGDDRRVYKADQNLYQKIVTGRYSDEFFRFLTSLYRKHFANEFQLESYVHSTLPIHQTLHICNNELIGSRFISEEFTKEIMNKTNNHDLKFGYSGTDHRLFAFCSKYYLANKLVRKFDDMDYTHNEKYKNLKEFNINSYFNEVHSVQRHVYMVLKDDYNDIMNDKTVSQEIKDRQSIFLEEMNNLKKIKNKIN